MNQTDEVDVWIERKAKPCSNCKEIKNFSEFHKNNCCRTGRHSYCRKCRGIQGSQAQLSKAYDNGEDVKECVDCELYFKSKNYNKCRNCRSKND